MHLFARTCLVSVSLLMTSTRLFGQQPGLLITQHEIDQRKRISLHESWAKRDLVTLVEDARRFPNSYTERFGLTSADPPPEGGQWLHWYACPDTGRHLEFHPPDLNICPDTGKNYPGYPYNHVVYQLRNDALGEAAVTTALAFRFTGERQFAQKTANILNAYVRLYPTYALHDNYGKATPNGAKAYSQTLDESLWLIKLAWAYDLVRGSGVLSMAERASIEHDVLRASAETVRKAHKEPTDNIQSWINCAIAAVGYVLDEPSLVREAIDGPIGFRHQMHEFVHEGFWIEGAWGYQFYAMRPLTMLAQMAAKKGNNLWVQEPALGTLFMAPLGVLLPNGRLPAFNDSGSPSLFKETGLYEVAFAATRNMELLPVLRRSARSDREALLFGVERLPQSKSVRPTSKVFPEAGYATLRSPSTDLTAILKFGSHGGAHGHYDKLNFVLFSQGMTQAIDPGTHLYGLPIHRQWDAMTIAHNTISVDQQRQAQATGKLLSWRSGNGWTAITADAGPVYADRAHLQRTMLLTPEYVLMIDQCASADGAPHTFDWAYHNGGILRTVAPATLQPYTFAQAKNGYELLRDVRTAISPDTIALRFVGDPASSVQDTAGDANGSRPLPGGSASTSASVKFDVQMLAQAGTQVFTGHAPGPDLRVDVPFVLVRKTGQAATFISAFSPASTTDAGPLIQLRQLDDSHYQVKGPKFSDTFTIDKDLSYERRLPDSTR